MASCIGGRTHLVRFILAHHTPGASLLVAQHQAAQWHSTTAGSDVAMYWSCTNAGACLASDLSMQSMPANSIVSFSADLDGLLGAGFPLGQVTELCALRALLKDSNKPSNAASHL